MFLLVPSAASGWQMDTPLSQADASFLGELEEANAGRSVSGAGDVNGDGYDDLLITAPLDNEAGNFSGQTYLLFGGPAGWAPDSVLSNADASFLGEGALQESGYCSSGGGDVNGDGFDDFMVSAIWNGDSDVNAGQVYLIMGKPTGWSQDTSLADADASFLGESADDLLGRSISIGGDVNADGYDDLLIGSDQNDENGTIAGQAYLFFGQAAGWTMDMSVASADASFLGEGIADCAGWKVAIGGDPNGDGYDDLLVSAYKNSENGLYAGQVYLKFGSPSGWAMDSPLSAADASFIGEAITDYAGWEIAFLGDVDGDTYDDFAIASRYSNSSPSTDGSTVYIVFGGPTGWAMDTSLGQSSASFISETDDVLSGFRGVSAAGDINDDGLDDLIVGHGANSELGYKAGQAYLVFGQVGGWPLNSSLGGVGASFLGADAYDSAGIATAGVGDVNGDGGDDLLIGAAGLNGTAPFSGAAFLFFGDSPVLVDSDNDGFTEDIDCNDNIAYVYPGAPELCDGLDGDCDGVVDNGFDNDQDGHTSCSGDCDDQDPDTHPEAPEDCDGIDQDCDGLIDEDFDLDLDGVTTCEGDCDDGDAMVFPGAEEVCNGQIDDDCDPTTDELLDADGDGFSICDDDCDDAEPDAYPGALEACDGFDNDCDGVVDQDTDEDADGFAVCDGDCNDTDGAIYPGADEGCDGLDTDCDGQLGADEVDDDADGQMVCEGDCDDADDLTYDGAPEQCDQIDNDCDAEIDEDVDEDLDADGWNACQGDCDNEDADTYPGAAELCDGADNDCDGLLPDDEADEDDDGWSICQGDCDDQDDALNLDDADSDGWSTCEADCDDQDASANPSDQDGDGWSTCDEPPDCNDVNDSVSPGHDEDCYDGEDDNCDGLVDEQDPACAGDDDTTDGDDDDTSEADDDDDGGTACECRLTEGRAVSSVWIAGLALWVALRRRVSR